MVDEDTDEEFVTWAAVVSFFSFFRLFPPKSSSIYLTSGCLARFMSPFF